MATREVFKCRWCNWTTPKWRTGPDGKPRSGWTRLEYHIDDEHPEQMRALQCELGESDYQDAT